MSELPSRRQILDWIAENPALTSKRDIAKAFGLKGARRIDLKRMLREMEDEGQIEKRRRTYRDPDQLPPVTVLEVNAPDANGDIFATPIEWRGDGEPPRVSLTPGKGDRALGVGDRVLARISGDGGEQGYAGRVIKRIGPSQRRILGIFRKTPGGGRILPVDKRERREWRVGPGAAGGAKDGELVEAEASGPASYMPEPRGRITGRFGDPMSPGAVSLIAIRQHGIPHEFTDGVMEAADRMKPPGLKGREDLRGMPLITIDPADARDHDDAVWAQADDDPANEGGHVMWVAIADVAHHVRPGSELDREARQRGNSTYFPDRVVPMLPDRLSGDLCSLRAGVPRAVIVARMVIDKDGRKIGHRFVRGLMRSAASLSYEETQDAFDGRGNDNTAPLMETVIKPLYAAYAALARGRAERRPLDLDLPERRIELDGDGTVKSIAFKARLDAHRLIEEFMVMANVAAAEELAARGRELLYRVHEEPDPEKIESLRQVAQASGLTLAKGRVLKTWHLNQLLEAARGTEFHELINLTTLRSMSQAYYSPKNFGHFGLALGDYAHFTSPIRRYADLIVHRSLIAAHGWGDDGLTDQEAGALDATAQQVSETERRSMAAERDTVDRYVAAFLADRVGAAFSGRISGFSKAGAFVKLDETGADGFLPVRTFDEWVDVDTVSQTMTGERTGVVIRLGQRVTVKLAEASPESGGMSFELLELEAGAAGGGGASKERRGKPPKRAQARDSARRRPSKGGRGFTRGRGGR